MRTSASEHVNKTLTGHHVAACGHPRLQKKRLALGWGADYARSGRAAQVLAYASCGE